MGILLSSLLRPTERLTTLTITGATSLESTLTVTGAATLQAAANLLGVINHDGSTAGFYGNTPVARPNVTGSRSLGTATTNLLVALNSLGLITDSTVA